MHEIQLVQQFDSSYAITMTDTPTPVGVRVVATRDNTSIRVSWNWRGVPMCASNVRIDYRPEGGPLMMYTVSNTPIAATNSVIFPNLQCNTKYTIWVHASGGPTNRTSDSRMFFLPARGMNNVHVLIIYCLL